MSSATMARAGIAASVALLLVPALLTAQTTVDARPTTLASSDVTPIEAESRALHPADSGEMLRWLTIAADGGRRDAQMMLGERYLRGNGGVAQDVARALDLLRRAAEQGSSRAQSLLGWAYWGGPAGKPDANEAVKWFTAAARQEDSYSLLRLSEFFYRGIVVPHDYARAKRLLLRAAELGEPEALSVASNLLLTGRTEDRDPQLGLHFLTKAANNQSSEAAYLLGREYLTGRDVPRDPVLAAQWFKRAADDKHALAALWLSELHAKGLGVPQDRARSERLLQSALRNAEIRDKNLFSWELSVDPDVLLRNSALAIRVLEPALAAAKEKPAAYLDTLAAAYADDGQFDKAIATQLEAIQTSHRTRPQQKLPGLEQRLELYRSGRPYREAML